MAPKRHNNGRSPLVNPQRQITSFFSKTPSPSPTFSKINPNKSKSDPNPNPNCCRSPSPSPSPTTPSPPQSNPKKPRLVIGQTPSPTPSTPAASKSYGEEVVEKRIKVYWPLDKAWYEGCVKSFDKECNKHLIQYEDGEEELLDLEKEKIEWLQRSVSGFKRLRRSSLAFKKVVVEDDEEMENVEEKSDDMTDSSDDDWDKHVENEQMSEDEEVDLVDEQEQKVLNGRKRKSTGEKKSKSGRDAVSRESETSVIEPVKNVGSK